MSADLTLLDESRPEGLKDRITQDPAKQRKTRLTLVDNFGAEHHLTGEHKIPNGASFDRESAKPGQLYLHDDGVAMLGDSTFPIGAVRELSTAHSIFWGTKTGWGPAGEPSYTAPAFDSSSYIGVGYTGDDWNGFTNTPLGASIGLYGPGLKSATGTIPPFARLDLPAGAYELSGVLRYLTGSSTPTGQHITLSIYDASGTLVQTLIQSGFETAQLTYSNPASFGRLVLDAVGFTLDTSDYFTLYAHGPAGVLTESATSALAITSATLRIRRVA